MDENTTIFQYHFGYRGLITHFPSSNQTSNEDCQVISLFCHNINVDEHSSGIREWILPLYLPRPRLPYFDSVARAVHLPLTER